MENKSASEQQICEMLSKHPILGEPDEEDEMTFEQFLVYSARIGEIKDVQEMLDVRDPPVDINYRDPSMSSNTALHVACANGKIEIVKLLMSQKGQDGSGIINPNVVNDTGNTPLHYAALNG